MRTWKSWKDFAERLEAENKRLKKLVAQHEIALEKALALVERYSNLVGCLTGKPKEKP